MLTPQPIIGVDPSFRYLGLCIAEAPPGFYTKEYYSEAAKRMYTQQYAYSVEQFNLRWWECLQCTPKELAKISPADIPPQVNKAVAMIQEEWNARYPGVQPRIAFEESFVGSLSQATTNHLAYVGSLYHELWNWSGGNVKRLAPATHQRFFYRYAGVRLFGYDWDPKAGRRKVYKKETQKFVDDLYESLWSQVGSHPVSPTKNYRSGKKSTKRQYEAVADAVSVAVTAACRWEEL